MMMSTMRIGTLIIEGDESVAVKLHWRRAMRHGTVRESEAARRYVQGTSTVEVLSSPFRHKYFMTAHKSLRISPTMKPLWLIQGRRFPNQEPGPEIKHGLSFDFDEHHFLSRTTTKSWRNNDDN